MKDSLIQIGPELINNLVREHLQVAVAQALSEKKDALINTLCHVMLTTKVDEQGKVNGQDYYNKQTWLDFAINNELRAVLRAAVIEQVQAMKPEIEKAVKREVAKSGNAVAKAVMNGFTDALRVDYKFNVTIGGKD